MISSYDLKNERLKLKRKFIPKAIKQSHNLTVIEKSKIFSYKVNNCNLIQSLISMFKFLITL